MNCDNNKLKSLQGLPNHSNLKLLACIKNELTSILEISNSSELLELICVSNKIKSLNGIEHCPKLRRLYCKNNKIISIDGIRDLINLDDFECDIYATSVRGWINQLIKSVTNGCIRDCYNGYVYNMINCSRNNYEFEMKKCFLKFKKVYTLMSTKDMNEYYNYMSDNVELLLEYNYTNFIKCKYFLDNQMELIEKYNIVPKYCDLYKKPLTTQEECIICCDTKFTSYVKCKHNHIICHECFELSNNNKKCCVCQMEYDVKNMFYDKN